jgi:acyl-CoA synthetase (AMP-forming)/AMP-acid ligase II
MSLDPLHSSSTPAGDCTNLMLAWTAAVRSYPEQEFIRFSSPEYVGESIFKINSFYKRVSRLAGAFTGDLRLKPNDRMVVLTETPLDFALLAHAAWLTQQVLIPLPLDIDGEFLITILESCNARSVVFTPQLSARIAHSIRRGVGVDHWLVSGNATLMPDTPGVKRIDRLLAGAAGGAAPELPPFKNDPLALIALTPGKAASEEEDPPLFGVAFTQSALCAAAQTSTALYPTRAEGGICWPFMPLHSFNGILHALITPIFSGIPSFIRAKPDVRRFWEIAGPAGVTMACFNRGDFSRIAAVSKRKVAVDAQKFRVVLFSDEFMAGEAFESIERLLPGRFIACYSRDEAGGALSAFPLDVPAAERKQLIVKSENPSWGVAIPGREVAIFDAENKPVGEGQVGELVVRGKEAMLSYMGTTPGELAFDNDGYLHTKVRAKWKADSSGRMHLLLEV